MTGRVAPDGSVHTRFRAYPPGMQAVVRHNVVVRGNVGGPPMLFAHGYGCDQNMWRYVAPSFEDRYRVVLFDPAGAGRSDPAAYDEDRHGSLAGYARDILDICYELDLHDVVFV